LRIGIVGSEQSGKRLAKHLNNIGVSAAFISGSLRDDPTSFLRVRKYDIVHGLYMRRFVFLSLLLGKALGKITICHWMGTDVMRAVRETKFRLMALILNGFVDLNLVYSENLQKELSNIGVHSVIWPIPVDSEYFAVVDLPPMPERFSVLCKIADDWLYGSDIILKLAKDLPDVRFLIVPGKDIQPSWLLSRVAEAPNLIFLGWKDNMFEVYRQTTVLLRLTRHDGLSYMVVESLALGRQVIWSHKYLPFCHYAESYDQVKDTILQIQRTPELNVEGAQYVRKSFGSKRLIKEIVEIYSRLASKKSRYISYETEEANKVEHCHQESHLPILSKLMELEIPRKPFTS